MCGSRHRQKFRDYEPQIQIVLMVTSNLVKSLGKSKQASKRIWKGGSRGKNERASWAWCELAKRVQGAGSKGLPGRGTRELMQQERLPQGGGFQLLLLPSPSPGKPSGIPMCHHRDLPVHGRQEGIFYKSLLWVCLCSSDLHLLSPGLMRHLSTGQERQIELSKWGGGGLQNTHANTVFRARLQKSTKVNNILLLKY